MEIEMMNSTEIRQGILSSFLRVINKLPDEQLDSSVKNLGDAGFPVLAGMSRQDYITMVRDRLDDLGREELITMSNNIVEGLSKYTISYVRKDNV